jgi:ssDNA-binding Zn-finger/Zn-ribbon topoisomerase 1
MGMTTWRPSNYVCPACGRRLEAASGPDGLTAERCPNCDYSKAFDPNADEWASDELDRYVHTETQFGSLLTDSKTEARFPAYIEAIQGSTAQFMNPKTAP